MKTKLMEVPEAIMINVPESFFEEKYGSDDNAFRTYYESMGGSDNPDGMFYHFISSVPVHEVVRVFVCWKGFVQYKAIVAEFYRKQRLSFPNEYGGHSTYGPRDWLVVTGPVIKAPEGIVQRGFRGFRYCKMLF